MPHLVYSRAEERARWSEADDRELLAALRDDQEAAFDALIERKAEGLTRHAVRMVGDAEEARDIVQLTFLRVWLHRRRYSARWSPNTWLYRIATNLAIDHLRSRRGRDAQREPFRSHLHAVVESRRNAALAELDRTDVANVLAELAGGLSERQRAAFLLREMEGLSSPEVARVLGCTESTVRNHLFTARKHLRRELLRRFPEYAAGRVDPEGEGG